jgi:putative aminopeptidase FrvX
MPNPHPPDGMTEDDIALLMALLDAPGPSGFEAVPARIWRQEAERVADAVRTDAQGNVIATLHPEGVPRVMLAGHIDEIGLMVTHVDEDGYLYIDGIGGWDSQVLVGQRLRVLGREGEVLGVIGKKPIHLMKPDERDKVSKMQDLWVDVGARGREEVQKRGIRVGDPAVIDACMVRLDEELIASRSIDNRIGAFVVLEVIRRLAADGERPDASVSAVATVQEEIGHQGGGARTSAYSIDPQVAIVVDVTFATDTPGMDKKQVGERKLGSGPVLSRGSATHRVVFDRLVEAAEEEGIPYTLQGAPRSTSTDADAIYLSRAGVPTAVVSVPNRYMHSPNEIVSLSDLDATIRLIAAFVRRLDARTDFTPH